MNANSTPDRSPALAERPAQHASAPMPEPLRPAAGLVLGLALSAVLWLALLVAWLALR